MSFHPQPYTLEEEREYHERFSGEMDRWMDEGHGSCILRDGTVRRWVEEAFAYFEGSRYQTFSRVIMPNHIHALIVLHRDERLEKVLHTWKLRTARTLNESLGRQGQLWQHDYFDRLIRDADHFRNVVRYIRRNPVKARLRAEEFSLMESAEVLGIE